MTILYSFAVLIYCFVNWLIDQSLEVSSAPLFSYSADVCHGIFFHIMQVAHLFVKYLPKDSFSLIFVRERDVNLQVESSWPEYSLVNEI